MKGMINRNGDGNARTPTKSLYRGQMRLIRSTLLRWPKSSKVHSWWWPDLVRSPRGRGYDCEACYSLYSFVK